MAARVAVVIVLLAMAGISSLALEAPATAVQPPAIGGLIGGSGWQIDKAYARYPVQLDYQQWLLSNAAGDQAQLYVGTTTRPQSIFEWSGEFGYLGEGYVVDSSSVRTVQVAGRNALVTVAHIHHGAVVKEIAYSAVRPDGIVASGSDSPLGLGWDALLRRGAPYYAVRVTVSQPQSERADAAIATSLVTFVSNSLVARQS